LRREVADLRRAAVFFFLGPRTFSPSSLCGGWSFSTS